MINCVVFNGYNHRFPKHKSISAAVIFPTKQHGVANESVCKEPYVTVSMAITKDHRQSETEIKRRFDWLSLCFPVSQLKHSLETNFVVSKMAVSTRSTGNELDHPEVLSRERLIEILCERCMHLQDLVDLEKGDLVQLFYKHVTPLPQRLHQLRRAKRVIPSGSPNGKESNTSKGRNTIIRLKKR